MGCSMIILIDAYNLLKTVLHVKYISNQQRLHFLQLFELYGKMRANHTVILVFDGAQDLYEVEKNYHYITICYSGVNQIADDVIKRKIEQYKAHDLLLVTCDRELRQYGARYDIVSIGSVEFYTILQKVMQQKEKKEIRIPQTICKTTTDDNSDLDTLMELGSRQLVVKDQAVKVSMSHDVQYGHAKKDKKLLKKILKI